MSAKPPGIHAAGLQVSDDLIGRVIRRILIMDRGVGVNGSDDFLLTPRECNPVVHTAAAVTVMVTVVVTSVAGILIPGT